MDLTRHLVRTGGICRMRELLDAGVSRHAIRRALARGTADRVGRSWVAHPHVDAHLRSAARLGVALTCVTQAERLGLWSFGADRPHVVAPAKGHVLGETDAHVHWAWPVVPRRPHQLEDGVENALALVAACQPYEHALVIWESAARKELIDRDRRRPGAAPARGVIPPSPDAEISRNADPIRCSDPHLVRSPRFVTPPRPGDVRELDPVRRVVYSLEG